jgi:hypothetical protein
MIFPSIVVLIKINENKSVATMPYKKNMPTGVRCQ